MRGLGCFAAIVVLWSCESDRSERTAHELRIEVRVESDPGVGLAGVPISIDGERVGDTDARGFARIARVAAPGQLLQLSYECPSEHAGGELPMGLRVRRYREHSSPKRVLLTLTCRPRARVAVFLVNARDAGHVDVFIDGEWVEQTDSNGIAHISRRAPPGSEFIVELRPRRSKLLPTKVARLFTLRDADEIFVFDQHYRARPNTRPASEARRRILRIE